MVGHSSKSSKSAQFRVWQILYIAGLILFAEYLAIRSLLAFH
jgi:hypothetical protein